MTEHLYTYLDPPNQRHLDQIVKVLRQDGVIAIPTGTSWAFAADPRSKKAEQRIRKLKPHHPKDRPFSLMCDSISMASTMTAVDGRAYRTLRRIWPGPYTVLLQSSHDLPRLLRTKRAVVGVRVPSDPLALLIIEQFGGPLMVSTVPRAEDGQHLTMGYEIFEAYGSALDLVVDVGGELPGTETSVIDMSQGDMEIVRAAAGDVEGI
jgi:tRNA threonylcarbamoyl adenosine modification protein (Sua5/YciO/YrdC/YwlC family)